MPGKLAHWDASARTSSTIDRAFAGPPRRMTRQGWRASHVRAEARELHVRGISDHCTVVDSLLRR